MRVAVIGSGGREQAIAWACARHGHEVSVTTELPAPDAVRWVRDRYHPRAVETPWQRRWLRSLGPGVGPV